MHTTMHSPKMTRSLQQISDKFGGSLGSLPALPAVNKIPNKLQLGDKLHTVQVKVGVTGEGRGEGGHGTGRTSLTSVIPSSHSYTLMVKIGCCQMITAITAITGECTSHFTFIPPVDKAGDRANMLP